MAPVILWYRALDALSMRSGEGLFRWAGLLYLGYAVSLVAALAIVMVSLVLVIVLIGFIEIILGILVGFLGLVALLALLAIAFYNVRLPQTQHEASIV